MHLPTTKIKRHLPLFIHNISPYLSIHLSVFQSFSLFDILAISYIPLFHSSCPYTWLPFTIITLTFSLCNYSLTMYPEVSSYSSSNLQASTLYTNILSEISNIIILLLPKFAVPIPQIILSTLNNNVSLWLNRTPRYLNSSPTSTYFPSLPTTILLLYLFSLHSLLFSSFSYFILTILSSPFHPLR